MRENPRFKKQPVCLDCYTFHVVGNVVAERNYYHSFEACVRCRIAALPQSRSQAESAERAWAAKGGE